MNVLRKTFPLIALLLAAPPAFASGVMRVHFIDVGQGAATLIEFPCAAVLVDTGGERWPKEEWTTAKYDSTPALIAYLDHFFETRPDLGSELSHLVLTHPHKDHTRGVSEVLEKYSPRHIIHNGQYYGSGIDGQNDARDYASDADKVQSWYVLQKTIPPATGLTNAVIDGIGCDGVDPLIRVLWGQVRDDAGWEPADFAEGNNHSVVVRVDFGESSLLIPGDIEETEVAGKKAGIERLIATYKDSSLLDVDVLQVSHHGSHNGNTTAFLAAVSPEIAVIPVGPACPREDYSAWNHAHPRTITVEELENAVTKTRVPKDVKTFPAHQTSPTTRHMTQAVYATGWDGSVVLEANEAGNWKVLTTSGEHPCVSGGN
jgi:competence protein ComEC